jgi:hypothetical protein
MNANTIGMAAALLLGSSFMSYAPAARAGDVSNASLSCYVDTTAFDQLTSDYCASGWRPGQPNPTTAHFQVTGLAPGSYTFAWSSAQCSSTSYWCNQSIRKDTSGGEPVTMTVTIHDNATGASKTVTATAEYVDVWN